jgi:hypothetical protein
MSVTIVMPTAVGQDLHVRLDLKEAFLIGFGMKAKTARPSVGCEGLGVAPAKKGMRPEGLVGEDVFSARE